MATAHQPTSPPMHHPAVGGRLQQGLLACGLISSLLWPISSEVLAALLYQGYDSVSQTVSELSSLGAPTRPLMLVEGALYSALLVAFGIGVWRAATDNRTLRITGALLLAYGAVGPLWYPFPVTARANITPGETFALTDVMHIVLGAVDTILILSILGFGAAALGKRFRIYTLLTVAVVVGFGALTFASVGQIAAGDPTPWLGSIERTYLGAFLLWVAILSVTLLRSVPSEHT